MSWRTTRPALLAATLLFCDLAGCDHAESPPTAADAGKRTVTYTRDIAPIILGNCSMCHRPGQFAPFSLLTYSSVKRHTWQIVEVTESCFMPPWLPEHGYGDFAGERRLTDQQIDLIRRWVEGGAVEGDPADHPQTPVWPEGWQLGEPDLVTELQEPYSLIAEGTDVFRNFVIPTRLTTTKFVRAVEFRPLTPQAVHHAMLYVDESRSSRQLDAEDEEPGYGGMYGRGKAKAPSGRLLGWTPGKVPYRESEEHAWRLDPGTDLVLQLHMVPTGKVEQVRFRLGLHFGSKVPTQTPLMVRLGSQTIDIPAGKPDYLVNDSLVLPVATKVLGIYPHAHYLGKSMHACATLPGGERKWLVRIDDWDFNWQDSYRYATPITLPAGTRLTMKYVFDNSPANIRNPNNPPVRVRYGPQSKDEMGDLWVQMLPDNPREAHRLQRAVEGHEQRETLAYVKKEFRDFPDDAVAVHNMAVVLRDGAQTAAALELFRRSVKLDPGFAEGHYNLASELRSADLVDEAGKHYRLAVIAYPNFVEARNNLGFFLASQQRYDEAIRHYRAALEVAPGHVVLHVNLALAQRAQRNTAEAIATLKNVIRMRPQHSEARLHLADTYYQSGQSKPAIVAYNEVLRLDPKSAAAHNGLAGCLLQKGDIDGAIAHFRATLKLRPELAFIHRNLARSLDKKGLSAEAEKHRRAAARLEEGTDKRNRRRSPGRDGSGEGGTRNH
jgi:tetratricopeptide (TPR) repeat protein/mono/diheme cytochrome c family protein